MSFHVAAANAKGYVAIAALLQEPKKLKLKNFTVEEKIISNVPMQIDRD